MIVLRILLGFAILLAAPACLIDVPDRDKETFECESDDDCSGDYVCFKDGPGPGICAESTCASNDECSAGKVCVLPEGVCLPGQRCGNNDDCADPEPFCRDGRCVDPCLGANCAEAGPHHTCVWNLDGPSGFDCVRCDDQRITCGSGTLCVNSLGGFLCQPGCATVGEPCNAFPGLAARCASVEGIGPGGAGPLPVCVACDHPPCSDPTPECALLNAGGSAATIEDAVHCQ